tara:strand:- start:7732 stop:7914 length:183 start_codon:yes stop_codon:yes gene_type:complete
MKTAKASRLNANCDMVGDCFSMAAKGSYIVIVSPLEGKIVITKSKERVVIPYITVCRTKD